MRASQLGYAGYALLGLGPLLWHTPALESGGELSWSWSVHVALACQMSMSLGQANSLLHWARMPTCSASLELGSREASFLHGSNFSCKPESVVVMGPQATPQEVPAPSCHCEFLSCLFVLPVLPCPLNVSGA